jgi:hypothetical protein
MNVNLDGLKGPFDIQEDPDGFSISTIDPDGYTSYNTNTQRTHRTRRIYVVQRYDEQVNKHFKTHART